MLFILKFNCLLFVLWKKSKII